MLHCLQWYKLVLRIGLSTAAVQYLVLAFNEQLLTVSMLLISTELTVGQRGHFLRHFSYHKRSTVADSASRSQLCDICDFC